MTVIAMDRSSEKEIGGRIGDRIVHSQVLRIREEDQRIGESAGEGLSARDRDRIAISRIRTQMEAFLCSRPISRSSPLGNKTPPAINSSCA